MNASKENAARAIKQLDRVVAPANAIDFLFQFLVACNRKLPTEESYKKDRLRTRRSKP